MRWEEIMHVIAKRVTAGLVLALTTVWVFGASAADKIRVGKSVSQPLAFAPLDIGLEKGIWAKHGLDVEILIFAGDAKLQQAFIARSVEFGIGSGPAMGF